LQGRGDLTHFLDIAFGRGQELRVFGADLHFLVGQQPGGQPAQIPLRTDIRARAQQHEQSLFLSRFEIGFQVKIPRKVPHARLRLVHVPKHVRRQRVQPERTHLLHAVVPVLVRHALIMHFAGANHKRLAVEYEMFALDTEGVFGRSRIQRRSGENA